MFQFNRDMFTKEMINKNVISKINRDSMLLGLAVLSIIITGFLIIANTTSYNILGFLQFGPSKEEIAQKSIDYLNANILQDGQTATLGEVKEESGIIKIQVKIGENTYDSYITKDGKYFFPEAFELTADMGAAANQDQGDQVALKQEACDSLKKADKPMLEAYVVSRCPYGLQMQRAMADAVASAPSIAPYIKVRYMGSVVNGVVTAMHGEAEAMENLRQICIREEQNSKYWDYVACQMKSGDTTGCESSTGVDAAKLSGCIKDSKRGVAYAKEDFALNAKYSIQGSPTLILNGSQVSEFDFGGRSSMSVKNMLACSSTTAPDFASKELNSAQAATSFSLSYAGTNSGSANTAANCVPQ
ncbi:MAG: hypothetical protein A3A98_02030 [Candidatus Staskawiczbacteria bacterium RIFCSPLOWO2_01_FULL_40_39]|nr:MAG: hypothetical protein A3A98_02030 [Candidatus Staskawiczbacteria bacterium RIFCSPLOWO2_01_FULL_40_39]OGZ76755.1 MAG: hypothetical protein A3I87_02520 [Candidatus Staskawiczbacteria bacterium RIFCSPLOWO2_02_FULL_39_8]